MTDPIGIFAACLLRAANRTTWRAARSIASTNAAQFAEFAAIGKTERKAVREAAILMLMRADFITPTGNKNAFALTKLGKTAAATVTKGMDNHLRAKQQEGRERNGK